MDELVTVQNCWLDAEGQRWVVPDIRWFEIGSLTGGYVAVRMYRRMCYVGSWGYGTSWEGRVRPVRVDVLFSMRLLSWGALMRAYSSAGDVRAEHMGEDEWTAFVVMVERVMLHALCEAGYCDLEVSI